MTCGLSGISYPCPWKASVETGEDSSQRLGFMELAALLGRSRPASALTRRSIRPASPAFTAKVPPSWPGWLGPSNNLRPSQMQASEKNTYPEGCVSHQSQKQQDMEAGHSGKRRGA